MKTRRSLLLATLLLGTLSPASARSDASSTMTVLQATAQTVTLNLGPGALATIAFPEAVTDATVTRSGLVDTKVIGNRLLLAGLGSTGSTPIQITTETQTYTWRVQLSSDAAGSIVTVTVTDQARGTQASGQAFPPVTRGVVTPQSLGVPPVPSRTATQVIDAQGNLKTSGGTSAGPVEVSFTATRDGDTVVVQYRLHATADATFDERQLSAQGGVVRPSLTTFRVSAGQTRYGTVTVGLDSSFTDLPLHWVYRVGLTTLSVDQSVAIR